MLGPGGCQLNTAGGFCPARPWCFDIMVVPGLKTCLFQFPGDQTVEMFYPVDLGSSLSLTKTRQAVLASELPKRYSRLPEFVVEIALCVLDIIHVLRMRSN